MKRLAFLVIFLFLIGTLAYAQHKTVVYFFWRPGCPHCAAEKPFLEEMKTKYPDLEVKSLDVSIQENSALFREMSKAYGTDPIGVPMTFVGEEYIIGYGDYETSGKFIEEKIANCVENGCIDPIEKLGGETEDSSLLLLVGLTSAVIIIAAIFWFYFMKKPSKKRNL